MSQFPASPDPFSASLNGGEEETNPKQQQLHQQPQPQPQPQQPPFDTGGASENGMGKDIYANPQQQPQQQTFLGGEQGEQLGGGGSVNGSMNNAMAGMDGHQQHQQHQQQHPQQQPVGLTSKQNHQVETDLFRAKAMVLPTYPTNVVNQFQEYAARRQSGLQQQQEQQQQQPNPSMDSNSAPNPFADGSASTQQKAAQQVHQPPHQPPHQPSPKQPPQQQQQQQQQEQQTSQEENELLGTILNFLADAKAKGELVTPPPLADYIKQATGKPWGAYWQPKFGHMLKFLQKHEDKISVVKRKYIVQRGDEAGAKAQAEKENPKEPLPGSAQDKAKGASDSSSAYSASAQQQQQQYDPQQQYDQQHYSSSSDPFATMEQSFNNLSLAEQKRLQEQQPFMQHPQQHPQQQPLPPSFPGVNVNDPFGGNAMNGGNGMNGGNDMNGWNGQQDPYAYQAPQQPIQSQFAMPPQQMQEKSFNEKQQHQMDPFSNYPGYNQNFPSQQQTPNAGTEAGVMGTMGTPNNDPFSYNADYSANPINNPFTGFGNESHLSTASSVPPPIEPTGGSHMSSSSQASMYSQSQFQFQPQSPSPSHSQSQSQSQSPWNQPPPMSLPGQESDASGFDPFGLPNTGGFEPFSIGNTDAATDRNSFIDTSSWWPDSPADSQTQHVSSPFPISSHSETGSAEQSTADRSNNSIVDYDDDSEAVRKEKKAARKAAKKAARESAQREAEDEELARKLQEEEYANAGATESEWVTLTVSEMRDLAEKELGRDNVRIIAGFTVKKYGREGRPHQRKMWITASLTHLAWSSSLLDGSHRGIELRQVTDIIVGQMTHTISKSTSDKNKVRALCFSLITNNRTLDLQACSVIQRDTLVAALKKVLEFNKKYRPQKEDRYHTKIQRITSNSNSGKPATLGDHEKKEGEESSKAPV